MNARTLIAAIFVVALGHVPELAAQQAAPPAAPAASSGAPAQAQLDQEWLTAYMMAHEGYRLNHMEALEDKFSKMTPTQLATLRMFYEQKHNAMVQQQQLFQQAQAHQVALAQMNVQKQQRSMNLINQEESGAANVEDQRLNVMHQEAFEASQEKSMPYGYGAYGGGYPYGAVRGGNGPYYHVPPY